MEQLDTVLYDIRHIVSNTEPPPIPGTEMFSVLWTDIIMERYCFL